MDDLTHALLGAVTAQLGFRSRLGRSAPWVAAAAAMLPDVDVSFPRLLTLMGEHLQPLDSLRYHRGITHSLLVVPVLALLVAGAWWLVMRALRR
jgi:inner membrane protein